MGRLIEVSEIVARFEARDPQGMADARCRVRAFLAPIPEGAMRVAPGTDAVVWKVNPGKTGEL